MIFPHLCPVHDGIGCANTHLQIAVFGLKLLLYFSSVNTFLFALLIMSEWGGIEPQHFLALT